MKDNFVEEEEQSVGEFFEQRREEFRRIKRIVRLGHAATILSLLAGIEYLALFDWRVGVGVFFVALSVVLVSAFK